MFSLRCQNPVRPAENGGPQRGSRNCTILSWGECLQKIKCFILILTVSIAACNKVQMTDVASVESLNAPQSTAYVIDTCAGRTHQHVTANLNFPKPDKTCEWGKDGNLAVRDHYFQGRIEQVQAIELPANSIICDLNFNFVEQQFLYDDHFLVSFNDAIIASSYNFDSTFSKQYGLLRYDWKKMAGMFWDHKAEGVFCAPGGACAWPATDTPGSISLNYDALVFQKLMAENLGRTRHEIKFVSIGDNDAGDCEHSEVNFSIDVDYVSK